VCVRALKGQRKGVLSWLLNLDKTHKHTAFRNGLGWFEDGGMPIAYTHPRGEHAEHSSRPGQGDSARSVKLKLLLQAARLVYMQGDEDEVRGSNSGRDRVR
jgi:hypothetical protein